MKHKPELSEKKAKSPKILHFEGSSKWNSSSKYSNSSKVNSLHRNSTIGSFTGFYLDIENTESRSIEPLKEREDYYVKQIKNPGKESFSKLNKHSQKMYYIHHSKTM